MENTLTRQQIFDKSISHLIRQGARSIKSGMCLYRSPEGRSCAVGCLIPDSAYLKEFDEDCVPGYPDEFASTAVQHRAKDATFKAALMQGGVDVEDLTTLKLLEVLQKVHDSADSLPEGFTPSIKEKAKRAATRFDLVFDWAALLKQAKSSV